MTQQIINNGAAPNDGTGESLRTAFDKCNGNFTELYGLGPYQPLDADLTAIAALTGTNNIYYRSGIDTWSPVTIGSGIDFTGGTLTGTGGAAGTSEYTFSTTISAPPASGQIRLNNATPSSATIFWISNFTQPGTDIKHYLETIPVGANVAIQDKNDSSKYAKYQVASAPVDNTTYFEIPVTFVAGGSAIANNTRVLFIVGAGASYQPLDGDLTALAALTGINTIYYRSAADTWSPVTVGSNMTFSGGTLNSVAGGNMSNTGTPVANQWAQFTDATHIQGVTTASMPFVELAGDTMTGVLTLSADPTSALHASTKQYVDARAVPNCGKLAYSSTTALTFTPFGADRIKLNGVIYPIPSAGIAGLANTGVYVDGVAGQNLTANAGYLVFVQNVGGVLTADFRPLATGWQHSPSLTAGNLGVEVLSSGASQYDGETLIGMVRTNASSQFVNGDTQRFVRTWFHDPGISGFKVFAANRTTTSGTFVELSSAERIEFLAWSGEFFALSVGGQVSNSGAGGSSYLRAGLDGAYVAGQSAATSVTAAATVALAVPTYIASLSEGYHYQQAFGAAAGGTSTYYSDAVAMACHSNGTAG